MYVTSILKTSTWILLEENPNTVVDGKNFNMCSCYDVYAPASKPRALCHRFALSDSITDEEWRLSVINCNLWLWVRENDYPVKSLVATWPTWAETWLDYGLTAFVNWWWLDLLWDLTQKISIPWGMSSTVILSHCHNLKCTIQVARKQVITNLASHCWFKILKTK